MADASRRQIAAATSRDAQYFLPTHSPSERGSTTGRRFLIAWVCCRTEGSEPSTLESPDMVHIICSPNLSGTSLPLHSHASLRISFILHSLITYCELLTKS